MKKHIPNAITLCNLICGCIAVRYAFADKFMASLLFIVIGALFDFFDGFAARKLNVVSPIGKELDSLADVITFGFAPTSMVFALLTSYIHGYAADANFLVSTSYVKYVNAIAFLIAAFSALRLAKFNTDDRQTHSFIGLPTPANALLLASIVITASNHMPLFQAIGGQTGGNLVGIIFLGAVSVVSSFLLVSEIPFFALKFKNFGWADNKVRFIFLITSAILLIAMACCSLTRLIAGVGIVIAWYIVLSLATCRKK